MSNTSQWKTRDGQSLYVFEMSDAHLATARAMCERALAKKEEHICDWDSDGEWCSKCDKRRDREERWTAWINRFDEEARRRRADQVRRGNS